MTLAQIHNNEIAPQSLGGSGSPFRNKLRAKKFQGSSAHLNSPFTSLQVFCSTGTVFLHTMVCSLIRFPISPYMLWYVTTPNVINARIPAIMTIRGRQRRNLDSLGNATSHEAETHTTIRNKRLNHNVPLNSLSVIDDGSPFTHPLVRVFRTSQIRVIREIAPHHCNDVLASRAESNHLIPAERGINSETNSTAP